MTDKYMKKGSTSLVIGQVQIKTTMRYHFVPTRMAMNKMNSNKGWQRCGVIHNVYTAGENVKWCSCYEKKIGIFSIR